MTDKRISTLLALSLLSAPIALPASSPTPKPTIDSTSHRASLRRMKHQLAATPMLQVPQKDYIQPPLANHIDAPLPQSTSSDQLVGIYGNILYPQDKEQIPQKKLADWFEAYSKDSSIPFPLSSEELNDVSLYILNRFTLGTLRNYFADQVRNALTNGQSLENALETGREATLIRANLYREIAQKIPSWKGRSEILAQKLNECADQAEEIIYRDTKKIRANPTEALQPKSFDLIEAPYSWEMRLDVFKQMVDKVTSLSPNSPYFLALQEVTPQALSDLKKTLADRDLQWISFNNMTGKATLAPQQEEVLGEANAFTSTFALSRDLEVIKVELGDLPTESGSIRKILGVQVRNIHTNETFNLFSTHTDHKIQNDIYARTAAKIHQFATQFFQDSSQRFVIGGDLNAFEGSGGDKYIERLHELFGDSQDFRETDYYAPHPIAWSSFIGRFDDTYSKRLAIDGIVEPSALDQIIVGNGVELQSAAREALVYDDSGKLLDYYTDREAYLTNLQKRITFSDHFFNIVRFK
jgi:endonuclease/exonuclease/phosphatase family metal-dependent hydrolase